MSAWAYANQARSNAADRKAYRLAACMLNARCVKEAAFRAGIPERTARRLLQRIG